MINLSSQVLQYVIVAFALTSWGSSYAQLVPDSPEYQELKRKGLLPPQGERIQRNVLINPSSSSSQELGSALSANSTSAAPSSAGCLLPHATGISCTIENPADEAGWSEIAANDDSSTLELSLNFTFDFYGDSYNSVFINNNGNISFNRSYHTFSATGFPAPDTAMIAPFWADVDTRGIGRVFYKIEATRMTVVWYEVGYWNSKKDKTNTFKLIITNGNDPSIGIGNNVAFIYQDMQWTTGGASRGINGFGGIPATVGVNKGTGQNDCFYFQIGRFNKVGGDFIDCNQNSGIDFLDGKCFAFNVAQFEGVTASFTTTQSLCTTLFDTDIDNPNGCAISGYQWDFGDGTISNEPNPLHTYDSEGTYTVSLTANYQCGDCTADQSAVQQQVVISAPEDLFKDTIITVQTQQIDQVLSASATTFSDAWPVDHPSEALNERPSFLNGSQGVWRQKESFVYDKPRERQSASEVDPAKDGYFTLETFNWQKANLRAIPNWLPANEVTKYSPYGYELENRDVLNRHSAALYGYGGQLPQAIGTNMRYDEMAYTGFEYLDNQRDGNWQLGTDPSPAYQYFEVQTGRKRIVLVKAPLAALEDADVVDVVAKRFLRPARYVAQNPIVCRYTHEDNPDWSVLVLERPVVDHIWWGHIILRGTPSPGISTTLDAGWAHSGKKSLKTTGDLTLPQELLSLDSGKQYLLSAWVSVKNLALTEPQLADGIGLRLVATNADDQVTLDAMFDPTGPVVEGWQQVRGSFTYPGEKAKLTLTFKKGTAATAWFDDLRLHPVEGNMQAYVYNPNDFRLQATLDENGYATLYYYDQEGNLYLTKKETERGIQTIQESIDHQASTNN